MQRLLWVLATLTACHMTAGTETTIDWQEPSAPRGQQSPPGDLSLRLSGGVVGGSLTFDVTGANTGDLVYIARSVTGLGDGPCFDAIGGSCLSITGAPTLHGTLWTDADGAGTLVTSIPEIDALVLTELCFQAVVRRGAGGSLSELATPQCVTLDVDSDGDGVPDVEDLCDTVDAATLEFPSASSTTSSSTTLGAGGGGVMFTAGSFINEDFPVTGTNVVTGLDMSFAMSNLTSGCAVDLSESYRFDVFLNGVLVGDYEMGAGSGDPTTFELSYSFPAIYGTGVDADDYRIEIIAQSTVCTGGWAWNYYPGGITTLRNDGDCDDGGDVTDGDWFFGPYEGAGTAFDPSVQWNGTLACEEQCASVGRSTAGARWVCNHWDDTTSEGCGPYNHGEWSPEWCTEQIIDDVYIAGDNPACGGETQLRGFLTDAGGSESYTWHAISCRCL